MIRSTPLVDHYERDGRVLLLFEHRLIEPGPLSAVIIDLASDGIGFNDLVDEVVEEFGEPADGSARDLIRACVDELASHGVLTEDGGPR